MEGDQLDAYSRNTSVLMAKRFVDTDMFRKPMVRTLQPRFKLLWLYLLCECDHAGVWDVELDVAGMRLGFDMEEQKCLDAFGSAIVPFDGGKKWWLPDFVRFQYGELNPLNRVHASVINVLSRYEKELQKEGAYKPLISPLQGAKDKDKENTVRRKEQPKKDERFDLLFVKYDRYGAKGKSLKYWQALPEPDKAAIEAKVDEYVKSTPGCDKRMNLEGWINPAERRWERPIIVREIQGNGTGSTVSAHLKDANRKPETSWQPLK